MPFFISDDIIWTDSSSFTPSADDEQAYKHTSKAVGKVKKIYGEHSHPFLLHCGYMDIVGMGM